MLKNNPKLLQIIISLIVLTTLLLFTLGIESPQIDLVSIVYITARSFALVGITTFSINLFLAGRYKFLDKIAGGLDKVFRLHRFTGKTTYILILLHISFISLYYFLLSPEVFVNLVLSLDFPTLLGKTTFTLFTIILGITLYTKIKYEIKQLLHKCLGFILAMGFLHGLLEMSDLEFNLPLRIYLIVLVSISILSYILRNIFRNYLVKQHDYEIVSNTLVNKNVHEITLSPNNTSEKLNFTPGQFAFFRFFQDGFPSERHPFSITSKPNNINISINPKISGDFTSRISELKIGSKVKIEGPYGAFNNTKSDQVWIAGGIGITPFLSMIRDLESKDNYHITLVHSISTNEDTLYSDELLEKSGEISNFKFLQWITKDSGHLSFDKLKLIENPLNKKFSICGPEQMTKSIIKDLKKNGVKSSDINFELFKMF